MEIFRLFESTMADVQPGHNIKHLRRDQLLDNYEAAAKTLQTLIRAKESEIVYRKDLIKMLEDSKTYHDNRLLQAKQEYHTAKSHIPEGIDLKSISTKSNSVRRSTTPPLPHSLPPPVTPASSTSSQPSLTPANHFQSHPIAVLGRNPDSARSSDSDLHAPGSDSDQSRGSLDRRLSEFLKTFPNLTQTGMAPPNNLDHNQLQHQQLQQQRQPQPLTKPTPGYYTQQPAMLPSQMLAAPPSIELLRYPPPFFPRNDRGTN